MMLQSHLFRHPGSKRLLRAIALLLVVVWLHVIVVGWMHQQSGIAAPSEPPIVTASLQALPVSKPPPPLPKPAVIKPSPKARTTPAAPRPQITPTPTSSLTTAQDSPLSIVAGNSSAGIIDSAPVTSPPQPTNAPPSVTLKYDVHGLREGQKVYGSGKIIWQNQGDRYRIDGSASVLFFTLLQFSSEGMLDNFGVSPSLYTEKRFRKTATDTRFEHARNTITFSSSNSQYTRPGDAQDRASVIWQLAAIGRSNPAAFFAGAHFELFVAGVRDAEPWQVKVSGEENLDADNHPIPAWHLVRVPQPGSYDQKIDIWLAPQRQWYPVKIRYTESNGEFLEMSLSSETPL